MVAASSLALGDDKGLGLSTEIQTHLGRLLGDAYAKLSGLSTALPLHLNSLLERLSAALSVLADREEHTFRVEFEALIPSLYRFARSLTKSQMQADDLLQDTLFKAWRSRTHFIVGTNLRAWMFTIMRNAFYTNSKKYHLEIGPSEDDRGEGPAIVPDQLDNLDVQDMQRALNGLTEPLRRALLLVTVDGLSYEEAAQVLNCRIGTVKSRVSRGRDKLGLLLGYDASDLGADHVTLSAISGQRAVARV